MLHSISVYIFIFQFISYIVVSSVLQLYYYHASSQTFKQWKIRPDIIDFQTTSGKWWFPAYNGLIRASSKHRHPRHALYATINLLMSCAVAAAVSEAYQRGYCSMYNGYATSSSSSSLSYVVLVAWYFVLAVIYENVAEYYWHRMMHLPRFYSRLHKLHHYYKSPEPFDDMMIHPVEGFGYYLLLYAPPFLFRMPLLSFLLYMVIMGLAGILDHSGVLCKVRGIYDTVDHDNHHKLFNVNYSFPFPYMDYLHGTHASSSSSTSSAAAIAKKKKQRTKKSTKKKLTSKKKRRSSSRKQKKKKTK